MLDGLLKKVFGDKNVKATKDIWPVVKEINGIYEGLKNLSDNELINKTEEFKKKIQDETSELREQIEQINVDLQNVQSTEEKHSLYDKVDELEKELDEKYEEILDEILPEAFAVVKDTCRRLVGKSWDAAGNKITWDMIPYDVQLIGGIVLASG